MVDREKRLCKTLNDLSFHDAHIVPGLVLEDYIFFSQDPKKYDEEVTSYFYILKKNIDVKTFSNSKKVMSLLPYYIHTVHKTRTDYTEWVEWWKWENFSKEFYSLNRTEKVNKVQLPFIETICIYYAKSILEQIDIGIIFEDDVNHKMKIDRFINVLKSLSEHHVPPMKYPPYYLAQLLIKINKSEIAAEYFLPFLKKNLYKFWAWSLLGDIEQARGNMPLTFYAMALSVEHNKLLTHKVRLKTIELLLQNNHRDIAFKEVYYFSEDQNKKKKKLPKVWYSLIESEWYQNMKSRLFPKSDNDRFYASYGIGALRYVFSGDLIKHVVVYQINKKNKKVYCSDCYFNNYVVDNIRFPLKGIRLNQKLRLVINQSKERDKERIVFADSTNSNAVHHRQFNHIFKGQLEIFRTKKGLAGKVQNVFINEFLIGIIKAEAGDYLHVRAIKAGTFKGQKNWVGYKVIKTIKKAHGNHT